MLRRMLMLIGVLLLALSPASALADSGNANHHKDDLLIRVNGPLDVAHDQTAGTVLAISDDVTVAGRVTEALIIFDGDARISGTVDGDVMAFGSTVELLDGARITGDLELYDSDLVREGHTVVDGSVHERAAFTWSAWDTLLLSTFVWVALTLLTLAIALFFAATGGRQLVTSARLITERPGPTLLAALLGGLLIPMVALLAILTLFGIPIGITLLALLMPVMVVLGYVVAGTRLGLAMVARGRDLDEIEHPYMAAVAGVMVLNLIGILPFIGGMLQFLAAVIGAGALTLLAWNAWRGGDTVASVPLPPQERPLPAS